MEAPYVRIRQGRRRLVEDQDVRAPRERPRDGEHRLFRRRQMSDKPARLQMDVKTPERVRHRPFRRGPVDEGAAVAEPRAEPEVLGHARGVDEPEVLVDEGETLGPRGRPVDLPGIRPVEAAQDLDQRRLSGAVLSEEGVDLARSQIEIHGVERLRSAEVLAEAAHPQKGARRVLRSGRHHDASRGTPAVTATRPRVPCSVRGSCCSG